MDYSGAYIISRDRRGGRPPRKRRGVAALIVLLLILTAGIVFLAVILPRLPSGSSRTNASAFVGRTFYLLSVGSADEYTVAVMQAEDAVSRGGGGYIYNDGKYHAIAAAYARELDAKAIADVNGTYYISLYIPQTDSARDSSIADYVCGEFYTELNDAATSLDRGTMTEAAADYITYNAIKRLNSMAGDSLSLDIEYEMGSARSQLSYMRYIIVKALVGVCDGLRFSA